MNVVYLICYYYYGKKVKFNMIINIKLGLCSEDCGYCLQLIVLEVLIDKYVWLIKEKIIEGVFEV